MPYPVVTIALDQIEPHLCTSVKAVRRYEAMFRASETVPPILIERSGPGFRYPFQIYNGAHRRQGAALAGLTTIEAVIIESPRLPQPNLPDAYMGLFDR
jgi:ParB-like chromosome segregation protein Spo0J